MTPIVAYDLYCNIFISLTLDKFFLENYVLHLIIQPQYFWQTSFYFTGDNLVNKSFLLFLGTCYAF